MKKLLISLLVLFTLFFAYRLNSAQAQLTNPACLGISGKFTAQNWTSGSVMVGCDGDAGQNCPGQLKTVYPGQSYSLTKCSCPPYSDGCLKVAKKLKLVKNSLGRPIVEVVGQRFPNSCQISNIKNICGTNGNVITGNFKISCSVPTSTPTPTPSPTPKPSVTPKPSPTPTPTICVGPSKVTNVKVTCPNCFSSNSN